MARPLHQHLAALTLAQKLIPRLLEEWPATIAAMRDATIGCPAAPMGGRVAGGDRSDPTLRDGISGRDDQAAADLNQADACVPQLMALLLFLEQCRVRYGTVLDRKTGKPQALGLCANAFGCPKAAEALKGRRDRCSGCYQYLRKHGVDRQTARLTAV